MRSLELKIPPVAVALMAGGAMALAARLCSRMDFSLPGRRAVAGGLMLAGLVMALLGVGSFRRARTTVNPIAPESASSLVTTGIYRWTRNPMYLGLLVALAGWACWLGNAPAFAGLPAFVLYMNRFQIGPEERALAALFGREFADYRARVRRWL